MRRKHQDGSRVQVILKSVEAKPSAVLKKVDFYEKKNQKGKIDFYELKLYI